MAGTVKLPRELERYLGETENVILLQRRHVVAIAEPLLSAAGGLVLLGWLVSLFDSPDASNVFVVLYLALLSRSVWKWLDWRNDIFVVTNYRLVEVFGIVTRKVAMMPLGKVTDMSYIRSPWAKLFRYGTFNIESAGQDQALSKITFVRHPDETYRRITAQIFKPPARRGTDGPQRQNRDSALPQHEPQEAWWKQ